MNKQEWIDLVVATLLALASVAGVGIIAMSLVTLSPFWMIASVPVMITGGIGMYWFEKVNN